MRGSLTAVAERFAERAMNYRADEDQERANRLRDNVQERCTRLLDDWLNIAEELRQTGTRLKYQQWETGSAARLLYNFLDPDLPQLPPVRRRFRANRSMRDVEPSVDLTVQNLKEWKERE